MDNFKEIKNIIHNELKLSKKEIKEQVDSIIQTMVEKVVTQEFIEKCVREHIAELVEQGLNDGGRLTFGFKERVSHALSDEIGKLIANNLDISISHNGEEASAEGYNGKGSISVRKARVL